ncbi:heme oxygenase-like protein [Stipitochalara longipes BDJ]|nr:heme oxygenase-like protein [Stipitochalara longipes BDJ]
MASTNKGNLTTHLLALTPASFKTATQTPFLLAAGQGTLPKEVLQQWLAQDRLYAQAYMRFASLLLANIQLPAKVEAGDVNERLADLVVEALVNIRREMRFFEDVGERYGLRIEAERVSKGVEGYRELFEGVGRGVEGEGGLLDGVVLLWGTEKCYLEAWRYAKGFERADLEKEDMDGGALRKEFIPNWTSEEFVEFVEKIGGFVDGLWEKVGVEEREKVRRRLEELWKKVLDVERGFWPEI